MKDVSKEFKKNSDLCIKHLTMEKVANDVQIKQN